jgi:pyruvate formate lyase activating enzyme
VDGVLISSNYGKISALHVDPVEKKPLRRFMPGTNTLSFGSFGCNLRCPWCQNYAISLETPETLEYSSEDLVRMAMEVGAPSISYTYNEPTVSIEFVLDTAHLAKEMGLKNIYVTNGYISPEPLEDLLEVMDAFNIDVKTFDPKRYRQFCGGELSWVQKTVEAAYKRAHVEITSLLVTGVNDSKEDLENMVQWIASLDPAIPLHLSRYFPAYHYREAETEKPFLLAMKEMADRFLEHVYVGNLL